MILKKKKHGWVIEMKKGNEYGWIGYYNSEPGKNYITTRLGSAFVTDSRGYARERKEENEVVRKVEVDDNGRPVKIVKGR